MISLNLKLFILGLILLFFTSNIPVGSILINSSLPISGGNILYVGGSGEGNYSTIQEAINNASNGDTVFVYNDSSPYYENVEIKKSINLIGENRDTTIIDGNDSGDVVYISADEVNISGFMIQHSGGNTADAGIEIHSNYNSIGGNNILDNSNVGIILFSSEYNNISGNNIRNNIYGFDIQYSSNNSIMSNSINNNYFCGIKLFYSCNNNIIAWNNIEDNDGHYNSYGFYIHYNSNNNFVMNNTISSSQFGINQQSGSNNTFSKNIIKGNRADGIAMFFGSNNIISGNLIKNNDRWGISPGNNNIIIDNNIKNNGDDGISSLGNNNTIIGNFIQDNGGDGIYLQMSDNNHIIGNTIMNNIFGMRIGSSSDNNDIYHNNFINNTPNAYDAGNNAWDNGYPSGGNYWDDYNGVDNDGDGIGDVSYNIQGGDNQDRYPLMEPYGITELAIDLRWELLRFSGGIKNIGNHTAFNVQWRITLDGGFILIGRESSGYLSTLLVGEERNVSSGFVIGLGHIVITVAIRADNAPEISETIDGFLFLFFLMI